MKKEELVDYYLRESPLSEPEKTSCFYCKKDYCLLVVYLEVEPEEQKISFCCDHCFNNWQEQEIIIVPNQSGCYFLEAKPKKITSPCQNCWPSFAYWVSKSFEFRIFGKSSNKGECNTCAKKDKCHVVGEITLESPKMKFGHYFCSLKCCQIWQDKYEVQKRISNWKYF